MEAADEFPADDAVWSDEATVPDALGLVTEAADLLAVFAADRLRRVDAFRREALGEVSAFSGALDSVVERSVRLELAAAMRVTEYAAAELLRFAEAMVGSYPAALESLSRAGMTERHAQILVTEMDAASAAVRAELRDAAVELAEAQPVGTFRRQLRRMIATAEADTLSEQHGVALERRRVVVEHVEDAMSWVHAYVPSVEAHALFDRATRIAKTLAGREGEHRTLDQLRADVMCDLLIEGETAAHPEEARGIRAQVVVTVPALALLDDPGADVRGDGGEQSDGRAERPARRRAPAVVEGIGPIPLERARELCGGEASWMRVLTHPETGMVLSVGRDSYRPPEALRRLARWRADRCMAPGCGMPASRCEIDHTLAWEHGGATSLSNTAPLCKGHHIVKHHGGWVVHQLDDGALEWTSPTGRRYLVQPERRVPTFRDAA